VNDIILKNWHTTFEAETKIKNQHLSMSLQADATALTGFNEQRTT
jgi:hypothetical protein